jgi:hypothetical protein
MNKIFNISSALLLTAILLLTAACSSDSSNDVQPSPTPNNPQEISIQTDVRKMAEGTRAATIDDNTTLQGQYLKIDAYYHDTETKYLDGAKLHYDSSWKFWDGSQLHYYWPVVGSVYSNITYSSLDFVGFCPFTTPSYITTDPTYNHSTGISFTCNMGSYMTLDSQASMPEYLVAVLDGQTYDTQTAAGGALPLQFKHPFALIKFTITAASGTHVQINSISIAGLYTNATCTYNGTTLGWTGLTGSATMTIAEVLKNGGTTVGTPFVVIPNDYGTKYLTVNATWDDWSNPVTISDYGTNVDFNWEPGYIYTYNLTLDKYGLIVDTSKFTEQW